MKLTSKGQVTIPRALREQFGLNPNTEVTFEAAAEGVLIKAAAAERRKKMEAWLHRVRGSATGGMSTDELMQLTRGED